MGKGFMTVFLGAEIIVGNMIVDCITIFKMFLYKKKNTVGKIRRIVSYKNIIFQVKELLCLRAQSKNTSL